MSKSNSGATRNRSAISGRFVSNAAAGRWPSTTVTEHVGAKPVDTARSAISGRFVTDATAGRWPNTTVGK